MRTNLLSTLNEKLLTQPFTHRDDELSVLAECRQIATAYAKIENSIAVLSDLKADKSYIYNGGIAQKLGIAERGKQNEIDSIWEDEILNRVHPDDLIAKHMLELHYFHLLESLPIEERSDYHVVSQMRIKDRQGEYIAIVHRMFYICNCPAGSLWLSLCLYSHAYDKSGVETSEGIIVNSASGDVIRPDREKYDTILSHREKEILQLIEKGKTSKDIADLLSISKNTVDRHRQNILEKLRVKNSVEACRIAKMTGLI